MADDSDSITVSRRDLAILHEAAGAWLRDPSRSVDQLAVLRAAGIEDADVVGARTNLTPLLMRWDVGAEWSDGR